MRLIDADALIRRAIERYKENMGTDIGHGMGVIASMITDAPTIDAAPVVHGRWVWNENAMDWGIGGWVCSECKEKNDNIPAKQDIYPSGWVGSHYCPNCGARMDLEVDGE